MKDHNYFVYITTNQAKTVLYTGMTNDLMRRMEEHRLDSEAGKRTFVGKYSAHHLIYYEYYTSVQMAIGREKYIKGLNREKKVRLISHFNPDWLILNGTPLKNPPEWTFELEDTRPW